jgi:hypothetical protein
MKAQLPHASIGARRSTFADAPDIGRRRAAEAMIVREPITVILSDAAGSAPPRAGWRTPRS